MNYFFGADGVKRERVSEPCIAPPHVIPTSQSLDESQDEYAVRGKMKCRRLPVTGLEICYNKTCLCSLWSYGELLYVHELGIDC